LGTAAFLFCDHVIIVPLANASGDIKRFPRVLDYAMVFVTIANVIFAALAYLYFTSNTQGNVIANLPEGVTGDIVRIGISLEVLASFPLVATAGFSSIETGFALRKVRAFPYGNPLDSLPLLSSNIFYYIFRVGIITVLAVIAASVPAFGVLVSLVGSLTIAATGFVFPQAIYLKLFHNEIRTWDRVVQIVIIVFGIGMTVLGTYQSTGALIDYFHCAYVEKKTDC
jgi:amino acid permease